MIDTNDAIIGFIYQYSEFSLDNQYYISIKIDRWLRHLLHKHKLQYFNAN